MGQHGLGQLGLGQHGLGQHGCRFVYKFILFNNYESYLIYLLEQEKVTGG
jgi:hypothetical protein